MAEANFAIALKHVLVHEGGYVNDPVDPGGATMKGVTQAVYDSWRASHGQKPQSVRSISEAEMKGIYKLQYWDRIRGDALPAGVDYAVFDYAVNSGVARASKHLQALLGVVVDGKIGGGTLAAAASKNPSALIDALCNKRLGFLRGLGTFWRFGRGWTTRVEGVRTTAKGML
jgi:lysozyme family protein